MIAIPDKVAKGQVVSAEAFNRLIDAVRAVSSIKVSEGLAITQTNAGLLLALTIGAGDWIRGIIRSAPSGPTAANACRYDIAVIDDPSTTRANILPTIRPIQGTARIMPAAVDDPCFVLRVPRGDDGLFDWFVWALTESVAYAPCTTGGTGGTGGNGGGGGGGGGGGFGMIPVVSETLVLKDLRIG